MIGLFCLIGLAAPLLSDTQQNAGTQAAKEEKKTEALAPLTDSEQALNPREMLLAQPDFVADLSFFVNEGFGGYGGAEHVVRKGQRYREETQFWTFVGEIGKRTVRLYPQGKLYDEMVPSRIGALDASLIYPKAFALDSPASLVALGTVEVDGHKCLKIEVLKRDHAEKTYLYAALDLKNLIIVNQTLGNKTGTIQQLANVSLEVPDGLVDIPAGFKPIERVRWTKVESARVTYKGRPSKDYCVFRAPGGELFVRIGDAYYDWTYLYRPQKKTVEIEFEGLLVDRSGTFIWNTRETEAFSLNNYGGPPTNVVDAHLVELPNGIRFRSESYERDQSVIEITW